MMYLQSLIFGSPAESKETELPEAAEGPEAAEAGAGYNAASEAVSGDGADEWVMVEEGLENKEEEEKEQNEEEPREESFQVEREEMAVAAPRKMETPVIHVCPPEAPELVKRAPAKKAHKSAPKRASPPRLPFVPAKNPITPAAWCNKPGMTYAEKLKGNMRAGATWPSPSAPRVPPTTPPEAAPVERTQEGVAVALGEDSIYGLGVLFESTPGFDDVIARELVAPSPIHSNFSGTPGRCSSPTPSDASTDVAADWLITPPPCFLRSGSVPAPATTPMENLLIEHPSMSVYVRPFEARSGGLSNLSYNLLTTPRLHDVIDSDDDVDCVSDVSEDFFVTTPTTTTTTTSPSLRSPCEAPARQLLSSLESAAISGSRVLAPASASAPRQTLPKGQAAKALVKRNHASTQRRCLDSARRTLMEAAMMGASHAQHKIAPPPTALERKTQRSAVRRKEKNFASSAASRRACARENRVHATAPLPRNGVTRRHKIAACFSGANNNRKCNNIRC